MNEPQSTNDIVARYCNSLLLNDTEDSGNFSSWEIPITKEDIAYSTIYIILFILGIIANLIVMITLGRVFKDYFS